MDFNEYQKSAAQFAIYPQERELEYLALGLTSESGEVASKVKKMIRDKTPLDDEAKYQLVSELSDCLWYLSEFARQLGYSFEEVAEVNIEKLASRKARGKIGGSGDLR